MWYAYIRCVLKYIFSKDVCIGEGGFSRVYWGRVRGDEADVAIKHIKSAEVPEWHDAVTPMEIHVLKKAQGIPGVIEMRDYFIDNSDVYLVTETFPGCCNVSELCEEYGGRLSEGLSKEIFRQVYNTVNALMKERSIYHADVKENNILFDRKQKKSYLIDFGLSRIVSHAGQEFNDFVGTLDYLPPELYKGDVNGDKKKGGMYTAEGHTVWSLGVLLNLMLHGRFIYGTASNGKMAFPVRIESVPRDSSASAFCLLNAMLEPDPALRINLAHISDHPWLAS